MCRNEPLNFINASIEIFHVTSCLVIFREMSHAPFISIWLQLSIESNKNSARRQKLQKV